MLIRESIFNHKLILAFCFLSVFNLFVINPVTAAAESAYDYYYKAKSLDAQGKYKEAEIAAKKALELDNKFYKAYMLLGASYDEQGKSSETINAFEEALKYVGDDKANLAVIYFNLGTTYLKENNGEKAWGYLSKAYEMRTYLQDAWNAPNPMFDFVRSNDKEGFLRNLVVEKAKVGFSKDPAGKMSEIDNLHSKAQFQSILDNIQSYYPDLDKKDIASNLYYLFENAKKQLPDNSFYNFSAGFLIYCPVLLKTLQQSSGVTVGEKENILEYHKVMLKKNYPTLTEQQKYNALIGGLQYDLYLYTTFVNSTMGNLRAQKLDYKEILPELTYPFEEGQKYGLSFKVDIGPSKKAADFWQTDRYSLARTFKISIIKENQIILSQDFSITGSYSHLVNNTLDYAKPVKYIIDGYHIGESGSMLYIYQNYDFDKYLKELYIYAGRPSINTILLSANNGIDWLPLDLYSGKAKKDYLFATDGLRRKIVAIESLSENEDRLKITFVKTYVNAPLEYFNFKRVGSRYEVE